ncbi:MFS transporter [Halosolutus gelatinilyticus]|uniref:MFS transporter n=1 Tax=Halosolutus gelatinilyticus TaxID=2931975 RepID=UPI001FF584D2|nr:MFS transporter [Halosolutus gelatinilyticus]
MERTAWRYRETVLALCTLAFFVTMVGRLAVSPVVPNIIDAFGVSKTLVGMAMTGMWLSYAISQYPSGMLADRYGERRVILASIGGTGATSLLLVFAPHFAVFFLGAILVGAAAGLHYSVATSLLARIYDDLGTAVGVHNAGAPIAGLLTPIVVAWVAARYGWRRAVRIIAVVAVPAFVLFAWKVRSTEPRRPDERMRDRVDPGPMKELLTRPAIVYTGLIAIVNDFTWQGLATFLPTFLVDFRGYSASTAAAIFAAYFVAQGFLQVGVGSIADRIGRDAAIGLCTVTGIVGISLFVVGPGFGSIALATGLLALSMGWAAAVVPRFMDHLSEDERSVGFGLIRTVYMIVASAGSVVVGLLADRFGWPVSFGFLVALLVFVGVLLAANRATGSRY